MKQEHIIIALVTFAITVAICAICQSEKEEPKTSTYTYWPSSSYSSSYERPYSDFNENERAVLKIIDKTLDGCRGYER